MIGLNKVGTLSNVNLKFDNKINYISRDVNIALFT